MSAIAKTLEKSLSEAELARLRADLQAAQARIAELESGNLVAALIAANQNQADRILEQARQLDEAHKLEEAIRAVNDYEVELTACPVCDYPPILCECAYTQVRAWLAANPAPQEKP